ncbi:ubiquitin-conjugating enzyme/RWD-like protein [Aspergillus unguis]
MPSKLRRLAADHAALHEELPPNYLFPAEDATSDDITQLTILLAGPQGTPYSQGLWRLHLKLPEDYPKSPPKATFRTRIWHPNVEELTGAVCVDTLKRDWKSTLTLKDVLITISCLLIYPNPDSALNSTAGALQQENYDAFARQAKLMTSIHAPIPSEMRNEVMEAKMRGEDSGTTVPEQQEETSRSLRSRKGVRGQTVTMKKKSARKDASTTPPPPDMENIRPQHELLPEIHHEYAHPSSDDENENPACASKENDPSLSPSPVKLAPPISPRKNAHGKRPLSVLTTSLDMDPFVSAEQEDIDMDMDMDMDAPDGMTASERNIAANISPSRDIHPRGQQERDSSPQRKSPKLSLRNRGFTPKPLLAETSGPGLQIYEDPVVRPASGGSSSSSSNPLMERDPLSSKPLHHHPLAILPSSASASSSSNILKKPVTGSGSGSASASRKISSGSGLKKAKPRVGIRRL